MNGMNNQTAHNLSKVLGKYLCGRETPLETPPDVGQQTNMYDCGIMIILFMEYIMSHYAKKENFDKDFKNYKFDLKDCRSKREDLMKLVEKLHEADN